MNDEDTTEEMAALRTSAIEVRMDPPNVPLQYVDGAIGLLSDGTHVKINLYQDIQTGSGDVPQLSRVVVSRLVMSTTVLVQIHDWLGKVIAELKNAKPEGDAV